MSLLLYKPDKTPEDINELISAHKNLIYYVLSSCDQLNNQDCESAAWEALWDAVCTFDIYGHSAFSTYACTLIRNAVNDVLRKEAARHKHETTIDELHDGYTIDIYNETNRVDTLFTDFVAMCNNVRRNVMLVWQASGYTAKGSVIANICHCAPSYVSRVQQDFRAFVSAGLKEP